jgi:hypothetical protein
MCVVVFIRLFIELITMLLLYMFYLTANGDINWTRETLCFQIQNTVKRTLANTSIKQ